MFSLHLDTLQEDLDQPTVSIPDVRLYAWSRRYAGYETAMCPIGWRETPAAGRKGIPNDEDSGLAKHMSMFR